MNRISAGISALALLLSMGCADNATAPSVVTIATTLEAMSVTNTTGVVGSAVTEPPSVIVRDQNAAPMSEVRVWFTMISGTASLSDASLVTDASGRVTLGEWVLSRMAGVNGISATTGALRVDFSAIGIAGPPYTVEKHSGDNQVGLPGSIVPVPPTVVVRDAYGNAMSGAPVTFAVVSGGGLLSDATTTSNDEGIARPASWTLGQLGAQSVTAVVTGLTPTVFTATASTDRCDYPPELLAGSSTTVELRGVECNSTDGTVADSFLFRTTLRGAYAFSATSDSFDPSLVLMTHSGTPVAASSSKGGSGSARFRVLLVPGQYVLRTKSREPIGSGSYTVAAAIAPESVADCEEIFITRGSMSSESVTSTDCKEGLGWVSDRYRIYLDAGTKITITLQTSHYDPLIWVYDGNGVFIVEGEADTYGGFDARLVFTARTTGFHTISAISSGLYTLSID